MRNVIQRAADDLTIQCQKVESDQLERSGSDAVVDPENVEFCATWMFSQILRMRNVFQRVVDDQTKLPYPMP